MKVYPELMIEELLRFQRGVVITQFIFLGLIVIAGIIALILF